VYGGKGPHFHGGAGTVYIEDRSVEPVYRHLRADNGGRSSSNRIAEVERLNLTGNYFSTNTWPDTFFHTHSGVTVTSDVTPAMYYHYSYYFHSYYHTVWPLSQMFSDNRANKKAFFMAPSNEATLTFDLPFKTYVEHIRVYPYCSTDYRKYSP